MNSQIINIAKPEVTFKGQRGEWWEIVKASAGKTVEDFYSAAAGRKDPPAGWLRWYVRTGYATLSDGAPVATTEPEAKPTKETKPTPTKKATPAKATKTKK